MLGILVGGCGGAVDVDAPQPSAQVVAACRHLLDTLPTEVRGEKARDVSPSDALAAAWGDPAIVLRCGVERPAALTKTSFCLDVDGVGWLPTVDGKEDDMTKPPDGMAVFTTIGRSPYVEVSVPPDYYPQPDVLSGLAAPIKAATTSLSPCQ